METQLNKESSDLIPVILEIVSEDLEIPVEDILKKTRKGEIVFARQVAMRLAVEHTKASLSVIGRTIGGKDHATVLHAKKVIQNRIDTEKISYQTFYRIKNKLMMFLEKRNPSILCAECRQPSIIRKAWVHPETNEFVRLADQGYVDEYYCELCGKYVSIINEKDLIAHDEYNPMEAVSNSL